MDQSIYNALKTKGDQYGIPAWVWYPIVMLESGGKPEVIGDGGTSYGLLQIHAPAHPSFKVANYTDPNYQADFYFPELRRVLDQGIKKGLDGLDLVLYVERYGQRPKWTPAVETGITREYNNYMTTFNPGSGMLNPPGLNPGLWKKDGGIVSTFPDIGKAASSMFDISGWLSDLFKKIAFFIPAIILLTIGLYFLLGGEMKGGK